MELPEAAARRILDGWPVARLASVTADGSPHQVPIVFARIGERIWSPIDAKPKRTARGPGGAELARVRHIRREPRVSLLLDEYAEIWSRLWWLRVDGRAFVRVGAELGDEGEAAALALRRKYPQYAQVELFRDTPTLIGIEITRLAGWCAAEEAVRRWSG